MEENKIWLEKFLDERLKEKNKMIIGVNKLAEILGVSRETIYRYIKRGMPYHQMSVGKKAFVMTEVEKWLKGGI